MDVCLNICIDAPMCVSKIINKMKKTIITLTLALITSALSLASTSEPDSMYIYFKDSSIVAFAIADMDSIAYYEAEVAGPDYTQPSGTFTDTRDDNTYSWVAIDNQIWMSQNLNFSVATVDTTGGEADGVCQLNDVFAWDNTKDSYGKLYSWQAAQKACPTGWHLPTGAEWNSLALYLEANEVEGSNTSGFSPQASGWANHFGKLSYQGDYSYFWSSETDGSYAGRYRLLEYYDATKKDYYLLSSGNALSVRCIKD